MLYYIIMIIVLGGFGCILFEKLDGEYIETGGTAQQDLNANLKEINNRVGSMVYLICFNYFLVMSNTSYKMVRENKIIYKELNAGLYRFPNYFFPKNVIDFAFLIVPVLILIYPYWYFFHLRKDFRMFSVLFEVLLFSAVIGNAVGLFVGNISVNYTRVLKIIPYFFFPLVLLAGYFSNTGTLPWHFSMFRWISPLKWMLEIALGSEFQQFKWGPLVMQNWDLTLGLASCTTLCSITGLIIKAFSFVLMNVKNKTYY